MTFYLLFNFEGRGAPPPPLDTRLYATLYCINYIAKHSSFSKLILLKNLCHCYFSVDITKDELEDSHDLYNMRKQTIVSKTIKIIPQS